LLTVLDPKALLELGREQGQRLDALAVDDLATAHGGERASEKSGGGGAERILRGSEAWRRARTYLDEVGAAQRDDLHDALALRERDGRAVLARALQVLSPGLHPARTSRRRKRKEESGVGEATL
jgi:hypothetical protein